MMKTYFMNLITAFINDNYNQFSAEQYKDKYEIFLYGYDKDNSPNTVNTIGTIIAAAINAGYKVVVEGNYYYIKSDSESLEISLYL